jgi:hypothetical protein
MPGVRQLVTHVDGRGVLQELAEPGAGVGKAPGRDLNGKTIKDRKEPGDHGRGSGSHGRKKCEGRRVKGESGTGERGKKSD